MTTRFQAHFENGVLVPEEKVNLPEHKRLTVTVDSGADHDAPPESGVELVDWFARHRIVIDPAAAKDLVESDEYLDQEAKDES